MLGHGEDQCGSFVNNEADWTIKERKWGGEKGKEKTRKERTIKKRTGLDNEGKEKPGQDRK